MHVALLRCGLDPTISVNPTGPVACSVHGSSTDGGGVRELMIMPLC